MRGAVTLKTLRHRSVLPIVILLRISTSFAVAALAATAFSAVAVTTVAL